MLIVGLVVGIILAVGLIFLFVKSVVIKLLSMGLLVLTLVLAIALGGEKFSGFISPITIDDGVVQVQHEGKTVSFTAKDVSRIDVYKDVEGKIGITFNVKAQLYTVTISSFAYEWGVKNALIKAFGNVVNDSTV